MAELVAYGGVDEIGGNRLLLHDGRARVMMDFGLSFDCMGRFFHEYLRPRKLNGLGDYFATGMAPKLDGVYRQDWRARTGLPVEEPGVDGIVISHAHMDHVGLVPLVRPDVPVHMSAGARWILESIEQTGTIGPTDFLSHHEDFEFYDNKSGKQSKRTKKQIVPTPRPVAEQERFELGGMNIEAYDVDHSLPGARGYVLETSAGTVAYTGDFRFHGRSSNDSQRFAERLGGVDVLITEGTNMGAERPQDRTHDVPEPMAEEDVRDRITDAVAGADDFVAVSYPPRDLDRILSFHEAARRTGRRLLLTTKQAVLLDRFHAGGADVPGLDDANIGVYIARKGWGLIDEAGDAARRRPELVQSEYAAFERRFLGTDRAFTAADVRAQPREYMVHVDLFNMTELVDLAPRGGAYVYSKTEPFNEEMDIDNRRMKNWLKLFHLEYVAAHASGHASAQELEHMIDAARPGQIVPVHTLNAKAFVDRFGDRVRRPELGQAVSL